MPKTKVQISLTPTTEASQTFQIALPENLHPDSVHALLEFVEEFGRKMRRSEIKYGYSNSWLTNDWEHLFHCELIKHINKGDPRDLAIYALFAWSRGWNTRLGTGLCIVDNQGGVWKWNSDTGRVVLNGDASENGGYHCNGWVEALQVLIDGGYLTLEEVQG